MRIQIKCTSGATNRLGDRASAAIEVIRGSVSNYHGDAVATSSRVNALQSFDVAAGSQIRANEIALNPTGSSVTNTNVRDGVIFGYSNGGFTFADPQSLETLGQFKQAFGNTISSESSAHKSCGFGSNVKINVMGTETQTASVSRYGSAAAVGLGFKTGAEQILSGEAGGKTIGLSASSSNARRDTSSLKMDIQGTEMVPGFVSGYKDLTESFQDNVFANREFGEADGKMIGLSATSSNAERDTSSLKTDIQGTMMEPGFISEYLDHTESFQNSVSANCVFGRADGEGIHLSSSSSNKKNDRATANMNAEGDGRISNYEGASIATGKTAFANNNILDGGILAGKNIEYDVSVSDAKRNSATICNEVWDGLIIGNVTNMADISPHELTAGQVGNGIFGSLMKLNFVARETATKQTVHNSTKLQNPLNLPYSITLTVNR